VVSGVGVLNPFLRHACLKASSQSIRWLKPRCKIKKIPSRFVEHEGSFDGKMSFFNALQILMLLTGLVLCKDSGGGYEGNWTLKEKVGLALVFMAGYSIIHEFIRIYRF
jgi:hypothetical protein